MKNVQDVVSRIEKLCSDRNLTINTMLKKSNLHSNVVNSMRNRNTMPNAETLWLMANTLQVSADYLIKGCNRPMSELMEFLGEDFYTVKRIDFEDCICRAIENYEIEISGCGKKNICVDLYLWRLSNPLFEVGHIHNIKSKFELKEIIERIVLNIHDIENLFNNGSFACGDQSFSTGDVTNNSGVIGQINAPTTIGPTSLSNQENDLLRIYREADGKTQMKIMQFIYDLEKEV